MRNTVSLRVGIATAAVVLAVGLVGTLVTGTPAYATTVDNCTVPNGVPAPTNGLDPFDAVATNCLPPDATQVSETDTVTGFVASVQTSSIGPVVYKQACEHDSSYRVTRRYADNLSYAGGLQSSFNGTAKNATVTFRSDTSRTVSVGVQADVSVDLNVILAGVKATTGVNVSYSLTAGTGQSIAITVPPRQYGNGRYGVFRVVTDGEYTIQFTNCTTRTYAARAYSPKRVGWYAYTSIS